VCRDEEILALGSARSQALFQIPPAPPAGNDRRPDEQWSPPTPQERQQQLECNCRVLLISKCRRTTFSARPLTGRLRVYSKKRYLPPGVIDCEGADTNRV
jgi:hypothetical protein